MNLKALGIAFGKVIVELLVMGAICGVLLGIAYGIGFLLGGGAATTYAFGGLVAVLLLLSVDIEYHKQVEEVDG